MVKFIAQAGDGFVMETADGRVYLDIEKFGDGVCVRLQAPDAVKIWRDEVYLRCLEVGETT